MKKVYDCIMFSHELDLLEIRLNSLAEVVSSFIIVELDRTHSGRPKPFCLEQEDGYVTGFEDFDIRLIQLEVDGNFKDSWAIENAHRRQLQRYAGNHISADDLVVISDLDEIPNPDLLKEGYIGRYIQNMYYFYLNAKAPYNWSSGSVVLPQWELVQRDIQEIRNEGHRNQCRLPKIQNGGWHFSSVGKREDIVTKMTSFAHTEWSNPSTIYDIFTYRSELKDIHGVDNLEIVKIDETYPKYLQDTWEEQWSDLVYE